MRYEKSVNINADAARVWAALIDVERWPEWTASMRQVRLMEPGGVGLGSRARIKQPRMSELTWEVTAFEPGREFTWSSRAAGVTTVGSHRVATNPDGTATLTLGIEQTGALAPLIGLLTGAQTRRYLEMEAQGLKRCSETT